ncbi:tyrosine--tRNA ligase [Candidatus Saccharibacteria bacterium]|nr:tyrosine--tRNA ligase [Candidatus Saccharibacteria bacterium]
MTLSEELIWRGFFAKTTIKNPIDLDTRENKKFYWGADPSADSLTIGNLAALMMCACFVRHGYQPYLLIGGATGQIGDPKENGERELKPLEEIEHNKSCIKRQVQQIIDYDHTVMLDNLDWFKDMSYLTFLREIGKTFSMTQLLDRQFVQNRIGEGGSGISYAEFSYTLIQGYDFLHLYRKYGVDLQLCGADQYGNCASGIHLIRRLENVEADIWSTPLIIDPVTGRKFGKSEGNAIWLAATPARRPDGELSENYTTVFDFYQFWLNQPDSAVEHLLKIYTLYDRTTIEKTLKEHTAAPEKRIAQKALALGATSVVHGEVTAGKIAELSDRLFSKNLTFSENEIEEFSDLLPNVPLGVSIVDDLVATGLAPSKSEARNLVNAGAISVNGEKVLDETKVINFPAVIKKGKNKFAVIC